MGSRVIVGHQFEETIIAGILIGVMTVITFANVLARYLLQLEHSLGAWRRRSSCLPGWCFWAPPMRSRRYPRILAWMPCDRACLAPSVRRDPGFDLPLVSCLDLLASDAEGRLGLLGGQFRQPATEPRAGGSPRGLPKKISGRKSLVRSGLHSDPASRMADVSGWLDVFNEGESL